MERFLDRQMMAYVFLCICGIVLLQKISVSLLYRSLKKQTDQLPTVNKRWMKQLRLKFENTYRVNHGVPDVGLFVDRQVAKMKFFRVGLHRMNTFYRKAQLICVLLGGAGYVLGSWTGMTLRECTEFFAMGLLSAVFLQLLDNLSGNTRSMEVVKLNLADYLKNMLLPKLSAERGEVKERTAETADGVRISVQAEGAEEHRPQEEMAQGGGEGGDAGRGQAAASLADIPNLVRKKGRKGLSREEEEQIVRDVLKEFLA